MKLYLVERGQDSDRHPVGIFSTMEKAQTYISERQEYEGSDEINPPTEFELDVPTENTGILVRITREGQVGEVRGTELTDIGYCCYDVEGNLVWTVATADKTTAVKVTNEKRTLILANNVWGDDTKTRRLFGLPIEQQV